MRSVCFLVSSVGAFGGTGRVAANVANRMAKDFDVHIVGIYGGDEKPYYQLDERVSYCNLLKEETRLRQQMKDLRKPLLEYLAAHDIDIVFLVGNYQGLAAVPAMLSTRKTKFVFCDHGGLMNQWDRKDIRLIRWLSSKVSDATVALTEQSRRDYIERFHLPESKVWAIYNWIPNSEVSYDGDYQVSSRKLIWAGRLDPEKGVDLLLEIAKICLPMRPDWSIDVYGRAELVGEDDWQDKADRLGIGSQVLFKGPSAHLDQLYSEYAACLMTSYREGLGMVLLEAKAKKLPLMSFDIHGPQEVINDGVDGFLVPDFDASLYAEKLGRLMDDDELRISMSQASNEWLERFSEDTVYAQWQRLIDSLI